MSASWFARPELCWSASGGFGADVARFVGETAQQAAIIDRHAIATYLAHVSPGRLEI